MDLGLIFFFLMSLAEGLSLLFIFSKHYIEFLKPTQYSLGIRFTKKLSMKVQRFFIYLLPLAHAQSSIINLPH